ncbi:MAG: hypothetical protein IJU76_01330 [Desulfovibrionaceae bacterium]|nr:hypothetical protein [Desulfovibrionaceae bacterium]
MAKKKPANAKPLSPVLPEVMEIVFFYPCPHCGRHVPKVNPIEATVAVCDNCKQSFPIVPVDEYGLQYIRIMLGNGKAAVDSDFI